jgi:isocitrate dehydrogenase kinase/phosphatase
MRHHADLLDIGFWQQAQEDIRAGKIRDFFPYPEALRFCNRYGTGCPK